MGYKGSIDVEVMPVVPAHALSPIHSPDLPPDASETRGDSSDLIRAASFTVLPHYPDVPPGGGIKRTFSDNVLALRPQKPTKVSDSMQNVNAELFRRASKKTKKRMSALGGLSQPPSNDGSEDDRDGDSHKGASRTVGGTLKNITRRRTWMPMRSTSPVRKDEGVPPKKKSSSPLKKRTSFNQTAIAVPEPVAIRVSSRSPKPDEDDHGYFSIQRRSSPSPNPKSRSLRDLSSMNNSVTNVNRLSRQSSITSLKSRESAEALYLDVPGSKIPPMPKSSSTDRLSAVSTESTRRKDPFWTAFRAIEGEYATFLSKTSLQKAKTIRTVLLPFLSKHADRASAQSLRAEDLDRRVHILNKWWAGLLDLLNGRSNQSISGTDRPAFLEAVTEIMLRHEWRLPSLPKGAFDHMKLRPAPTFKSANSVDSDDSDFLLDSIYQNIRNIFVQNLLSQMSFVVDKLSMRSAPASLVNFAGKTCAYAFFFCPGVADVLVRLWHLPPGTLRRIFSEYGTLYNGKGTATPASVASSFPPPIRSLCFTSQGALARHIQPKAHRPPGSESIRWYGPWVNRWIGRDSDLFFVFTKYYHILVCEFHPMITTLAERVCVPGLAPVHAQMLVVLESTLYRHVGHITTDPYHTGDKIDTMAPLPMTVPNATRSITENRLVMLLRDLVSENTMLNANVADLVVGSFEVLMKAATRRVSMYNSDACFVLCDLLEEICPILSRHGQTQHSATGLDATFWVQVLQQMMQAHTTMTQIRVIALLYSMWNSLVFDESRRRELVLGWILEPAFFRQFFNHWSSMVRHYFLRLLCWRVARCDSEATELDLEIMRTLLERLNLAWAHHQYLLAEAEMREIAPPSSNPCSPAPGRALVIVRTDNQSTGTQFSTFDKILSSNQSTPYRNLSSTLNTVPEADQPQAFGKKRWSLLRSINPFSSPGNSRPGEVTPPSSPEASLYEKKSVKSIKSPPSSAPSSRPSTPPHQALAFKFSLEYTSNRPGLPVKNRRLPPPTLASAPQKLLDDLLLMERLSSSESIPVSEIKPRKPMGDYIATSRYSGRALAEWSSVISECRNFYTRRRQEGCPRDSLIETPTMAVESFRMFG